VGPVGAVARRLWRVARRHQPEQHPQGSAPLRISFSKCDLVRAFKAAQDAGIERPVITVNPKTKEITIRGDEAPKAASANAWDEVYETTAKRPA
jgi:hypothetical protein